QSRIPYRVLSTGRAHWSVRGKFAQKSVGTALESPQNAWLLPPIRLSWPLAMVCQPDRPACALYRTARRRFPTPPERQPHGMNSAITRRILTCLAFTFCAGRGLSASAADAAIQYNRDVRPILFDNCFSCHGPDSAARQADLRLDKRQ